MKKIIILLVLALLLPLASIAQSPQGRLPKTIIADVLAQMPAKNVDIYNRMMADLLSSGNEGLNMLFEAMDSDSKKDNTQLGYAIGGLVAYVTTPGKEADLIKVQDAIIKALNNTKENDVKAFFIRQLQLLGNNQALPTLMTYAKDKNLCSEAVAAIVENQSSEARKALESIFTNIPDRAVAASAAGELGLSSQEQVLLSWLGSNDAKLQKNVLHALARIGGQSSVDALQKAAQAINFSFEPTSATESYLKIMSRYPSNAELLLTNKDANIRAAALQIMAENNGKDVMPHALKAIQDPSREYRNAALAAVAPYADQNFYMELIKLLPLDRKGAIMTIGSKKRPIDFNQSIDIVNFLGNQQVEQAVMQIIPLINAPDAELRKAALYALARIDDPRGAQAIIEALKSSDHERIAEIKDVLMWYKTNQNKALVAALTTTSESGKVAIVEILAAKKASPEVATILDLTTKADSRLTDAAYIALADVATVKEFDRLCTMLETGKQSAALQRAISKVLAQMEPSKALSAIKTKMKGKESLYYPTLSAISSPEAFAIVKAGIAGNDRAAIETAIAWSDQQAVATLFDIYTNPALASSHNAALNSYITLINKAKYNDSQRFIHLRKALDRATSIEQKNTLLKAIASCKTFNALLLAGQYLEDEKTRHQAGSAVMAIALSDKEYAFWSEQEKAILNRFLTVRGGGDAPYDKAAIEKYLKEAPNAVGFESIFNGRDLSGWKGLVKNPIARAKMSTKELAEAQIKADQVMNTGWEVRDGILYFTGKGENLCTEKKYGNFEMYVDWKILPEGDAGIYLRGAPQVQIWDTMLVKVGAQVGSGGLYNNKTNISKPLVLADNAIGDWNTFYIKMVGERVTVLLNGIKVVDNVIMENYWDRAQPIFPIEQLELQAHGNEIAYRDIYVRELPATETFTLSAEEQKEGFKILFDGFSMNEWIGNTKDYISENGTITLYPGNGGGGNLYTKDQYGDFIFRFEFMLTPAANNGLGIRTPLSGDAAYVGTELQILDSEHPVYKDLEIYQYHGSAYGIIPAKRGFLKPTGEWNYQQVEVRGNHVKVTLNGTIILDGDLAQASKNGTLDGKDHPGLKNAIGHIAFLGHGSLVKFKNIRIKELKTK